MKPSPKLPTAKRLDVLDKTRRGLVHQVAWRGQCLVWTVLKVNSQTPPNRLATTITKFSDASRLRLLKVTNSVIWPKVIPGTFIHLTFDEEKDDVSYDRTSQARYVFWRNVERHTGKHVSGIWRIEWKPRLSGRRVGALVPHLHIMAMRTPFIHWTLYRKWWQQALQVEKAITKVTSLGTPKQCGRYISKYVAKVEPDTSSCYSSISQQPNGRHWGVFRPSLLPRHELQQLVLPPGGRAEAAYQEAIASLPWLDANYTGSFTLLGPMAEKIGVFLFGHPLTVSPTTR